MSPFVCFLYDTFYVNLLLAGDFAPVGAQGNFAVAPLNPFGSNRPVSHADDDLVEVHQAHGKEHCDRHMLAGAGDADFAADGKAHRLLADLAHRVVRCPSNCAFLAVRITDDALALGGDHGALNHLQPKYEIRTNIATMGYVRSKTFPLIFEVL